MPTAPDRHVDITENGRSGSVTYREPAGSLAFHWEFGGGDVVVIIQVSDGAAWKSTSTWFAGRRAEILRFVAAEAIRRKAPSCRAEITEDKGEILLTQAGPPSAPQSAPDVSFVRRFSSLKAMLGIIVLVVALIFGGVMWFGKKVLTVASASGIPLGECVRTDQHIAVLMQATDPHLPEISGRGGNTTTSISILLIPLDGSKPRLVPVVGELSHGSYSLARIMGSDGRTLWFDATGLYGVRLHDYALITAKDLRNANGSLDPSWWEDPRGMDVMDGKLHVMRIDRSGAIDVDPATYMATSVTPKPSNARFERHAPSDHLAAGFITGANSWLGLHSPAELEREFALKKFLRQVVSQEDAKQMRRFHRGELEDPVDEKYHRILSMTALSETEYLNAAFLRMHEGSEPLQLNDPDGALMIHTSLPGLQGSTMVARVDTEGKIIWNVDTGIDRFKLSQIMAGKDSFAFVGTRPPVPDNLSEPLLVIVENHTGKVTTHSLWR